MEDTDSRSEELLSSICFERDPDGRSEIMTQLRDVFSKNTQSISHNQRTLQRLAIEAAAGDVRVFCADILRMGGIERWDEESPSHFMPRSVFATTDLDQETRDLLEEIFFQQGRVLHFERVMAAHPCYMKSFYTTYTYLLWEPGPLLMQWRPYILAMGAAQHNCQYLVEVYEREFLRGGGDPSWLEGADHTPLKMQRLIPVTMILARNPWLLTKEHIRTLTQGDSEDESGRTTWSMGELAQALALATTSHFLAAFVWGCGISPELDSAARSQAETAECNRATFKCGDLESTQLGTCRHTQVVVEKLKKGVDHWKSDEVDMLKEFEKAGEGAEYDGDEERDGCGEVMQRYLITSGEETLSMMKHEDFNCSCKEYSTLHVEDYNWEDIAVPQLDRCYRSSGSLLDTEFRCIFNLTYYTFNDEIEMDTQPFRHAIWFYVQRISGIFNDHYDYQEVNHMLDRGFKTYCKKTCFTPTALTYDGFEDFGVNLAPEEKCHALIIALEARKQSSLLWALRAISQCK